MARKSEPIDLNDLVKFADSLDSLSRNIRTVARMVEENSQDNVQSTNWQTALRGLEYIERFTRAIAGTAATGSTQDFLNSTILRVADPPEEYQSQEDRKLAKKIKRVAKSVARKKG